MNEETKEKRCAALEKARAARKANAGKGLSRKRAMQAMCWECCGGTSYEGCVDPACPLYPFRAEKKQERGVANLWWTGASDTWAEASPRGKPKRGSEQESE